MRAAVPVSVQHVGCLGAGRCLDAQCQGERAASLRTLTAKVDAANLASGYALDELKRAALAFAVGKEAVNGVTGDAAQLHNAAVHLRARIQEQYAAVRAFNLEHGQ